ncbi:hypothetical protein K9L67_02095 [Candidatus Woesearchaeota archaeon]|nr:hypothetical protein [Candidatus Woesearchaeota archaeon]MCF7900995.1 hypothetical protein [Candidatus Woesearchaeota archaeon]MCF8013289.1 hypothetical protein [Candidatus Woesearchaeota archaeon]
MVGKLTGGKVTELLQKVILDNNLENIYGYVIKFGSENFSSHKFADLDLSFSPKSKETIVKDYLSHMTVLEELKNILIKDYSSDLVPFPKECYKYEVAVLSDRKSSEVFLHNIYCLDFEDVFKSTPLTSRVFESDNFGILTGDIKNDVKLDSLLKHYFFMAVSQDITLSNYSKENLSQKVILLDNFMNKHLFGVKQEPLKIMSFEESKFVFENVLYKIADYFNLEY